MTGRLVLSRHTKRIAMGGAVVVAIWSLVRLRQGRLHVPDLVTEGFIRMREGSMPAKSEPTASFDATIDTGQELIGTVSNRFLSFAIDSSLIVGGHWWSPGGQSAEAIGRSRVRPVELASRNLRDLARDLSPAYLRVGGTEADSIYYGVEDGDSSLPKAPFALVLTQHRWNALVDFVQQAQLDLFFTLNAGPSTRDAQGRWRVDNTERLLRYAEAHHQRISVLELGNEVNGYWFSFGLTHQPNGSLLAEDLDTLRRLAQRFAPAARIVAPAEIYWPRVGSPFSSHTNVLPALLEADGGRNLDAVTWHYYPQQGRRCPIATRRASLTRLLVPAYLDEISVWANEVSELRSRHAPGLPVWLSETGGAQCGGEPGVSDRFASSLWWLDELGLLATHGHEIVIRQALVGSDYGLLDETTLAPRPDYVASVLHKRLMGTRVLEVRRRDGSDPFLRTYAHCTPKAAATQVGAVTLLAINLHQHESGRLHWPRLGHRGSARYQVTAASLDSSSVLLNGHSLVSTHAPLQLEADHLSWEDTIELPPASYAFFVVDAGAPACQSALPAEAVEARP